MNPYALALIYLCFVCTIAAGGVIYLVLKPAFEPEEPPKRPYKKP